ncbi:Hpt domain-containing protein [Paragemmobacter straminiformis]|uniref:Hpt domain-containing protein n=1 Tax=Paragemmobacter straminiformis TaxID=2045119 RepID=A0A842I9K7_9RHOB|nr:Hpt domain-containing protein [Gemmobacter straminiformis]MBC2835668.1 Hpt domain-containing protein [Gemmobacter straminiformis]
MTSLSAEALAPIRQRFIDALRDREARMRAALTQAPLHQPDRLLDDIHKIRGVAPMLGMAGLGALAAEAEDRLEPWVSAAIAAAPQDMHIPEEVRDCLQALHAEITATLG